MALIDDPKLDIVRKYASAYSRILDAVWGDGSWRSRATSL